MDSLHPQENAFKYSSHDTEAQGTRKLGDSCIAVVGVGRAGNNAVTRLMESGVNSVECIAVNTEARWLKLSKAHHKVLIGQRLTKGRGVSGNPKLGKASVEESIARVEQALANNDIVFIAAGFGGGTGTGAAPKIAEIAKERGAMTIGVVTMPFRREKGHDALANSALAEMRRHCDTVVVIDKERLTQLVPQLPIDEACRVADQVVANMINGFVDTMSAPNLINVDLDRFKALVSQGGIAVVGFGESDAPNRAEMAVRSALKAPSLNVDYAGATGALINVTGDSRMTIEEANRVGKIVSETLDRNAMVLWGAHVNPQLNGKLKVTLVMTGLDSQRSLGRRESAISQLFNLEPQTESERHVNIDLDLYQMESV